MKMMLLAFFLAFVAPAKNKTPNPADYVVAIHIQSSSLKTICSPDPCRNYLHLKALIAGKKYELNGGDDGGFLLHPGDYKARIVKNNESDGFQFQQTYEILFSDGSTRKFDVVGVSE